MPHVALAGRGIHVVGDRLQQVPSEAVAAVVFSLAVTEHVPRLFFSEVGPNAEHGVYRPDDGDLSTKGKNSMDVD